MSIKVNGQELTTVMTKGYRPSIRSRPDSDYAYDADTGSRLFCDCGGSIFFIGYCTPLPDGWFYFWNFIRGLFFLKPKEWQAHPIGHIYCPNCDHSQPVAVKGATLGSI